MTDAIWVAAMMAVHLIPWIGLSVTVLGPEIGLYRAVCYGIIAGSVASWATLQLLKMDRRP